MLFFSILIPCYNAENTILDTINSCLNQTYQNFEIIVVDDKSTDNSVNIIKSIKSDKIELIELEINKKVAYARNVAWNKAKGDYICFLDADDIWYSKKLEIINKILSKNDIDILSHTYSVQDYNFDLVKGKEDKLDIKKIHYLNLLLVNRAVPSCAVVKRDIVDRFDTNFVYSEDHELFLRLAKKYSFYYLDLQLATRDRLMSTKGGISGNLIKLRLSEIKLYFKVAVEEKWLLIFFPLLFMFSIIKHFLNIFFTLPNNKVYKKNNNDSQ